MTELEELFRNGHFHESASNNNSNVIIYFDTTIKNHVKMVIGTHTPLSAGQFGYVGKLSTVKMDILHGLIELWGDWALANAPTVPDDQTIVMQYRLEILTDIKQEYDQIKVRSLLPEFTDIAFVERIPRWLNIDVPTCKYVMIKDIQSPFFIWHNRGRFPNIKHLHIEFKKRPVRTSFDDAPVIYPFHKDASGAYISGVAIHDDILEKLSVGNYTMEYRPHFIWNAKKLKALIICMREVDNDGRVICDDQTAKNHFLTILQSFKRLKQLTYFSLFGHIYERTEYMMTHLLNNMEYSDLILICMDVFKKLLYTYEGITYENEFEGMHRAFPWPVSWNNNACISLFNKIRAKGGGIRLKRMDFVHLGRKINNEWGDIKNIDGRDIIMQGDEPTKRPCRGDKKSCTDHIFDAQQLFQQLNTALNSYNPNRLHNRCPICRSRIEYVEIMSGAEVVRRRKGRKAEGKIQRNLDKINRSRDELGRKIRRLIEKINTGREKINRANLGVTRAVEQLRRDAKLKQYNRKLNKIEREQRYLIKKATGELKIEKMWDNTMKDVQVRLLF